MRMAQRDFQESLVYTLRGVTYKVMQRTSLFGNKLTLHPMLWKEIEDRVLRLYAFWFQKNVGDDKLYHHILEKYRYLKSQGVAFPPEEIDRT